MVIRLANWLVMAKTVVKLAWRHDIMVEEVFGLEACVITEQNLMHVADNIFHFSSPDNYWVFDVQTAVKRYVNQSKIIATSRRHTVTMKQGEKFFRIWTFREKEKMQLF